MIGQVPLGRCHLYIVNTVVVQHLFSHLAARQAAGKHHLRILLEDRLQSGLHDHADHCDYDNQYKTGIPHIFKIKLGLQ